MDNFYIQPLVSQKDIAISGDTYHNRFSKTGHSKHPGNKKYKALPRKCAKCGKTGGALDIDHKDGNRGNNNRSNLRILCRSCHRKMHSKRNGGRGELIISSAARIIQDPQTEISKNIAAAHKNSDIMHVEYILCHANTNGNQDEFTQADLKDSYNTIINKPVDWEHKDKNIGVNYESRYISMADLSEEDKQYYKDIDPLKDDFVIVKSAIWEYKFPTEANIMRERASKNELYFSMENHFQKAQCSQCNEVFGNMYEYCDHLLFRAKGGTSRIFLNSNFIGSGVVKNPADKGSKHLALAHKDINVSFASLLSSKVMKNISIANSLIPYILKDNIMNIRKLKVPQEYIGNDDLPNDSFADQINRCFPIDNVTNIQESAKTVLNSKLDFYNEEERLFIIEQISKAASEYDIKLNEFIDNLGGNIMVDVNSPEFKQAVAEALNHQMTGTENDAKFEEMKNQIRQLADAVNLSKTKAEALENDKKAIAKEYQDYKNGIKTKEIVSARLNTLNDKNLKFTDNKEYIETSIASMTDEQFNSFVSSLEELAKATHHMTEEEMKKKMEDEKKKKAAKADVVAESRQTAIASKTEDGTQVYESAIDKVLASALIG